MALSICLVRKLETGDSEEKNWENWAAAWIEKLVD